MVKQLKMTKKYTELEMIKILEEEQLHVAQIETQYYKKRGIIKSGDSLKSFIKTAEQLFEDVSVTGRGKKRVYTVGNKRDTIVDRIDGRENNGGHNYSQGFAVPIVKRPQYDQDFKEYICKKYNATIYSPQMVLLEYGYNTYESRLFSHSKKNKGNKKLRGNYIYRFHNKNNEIIYIGLTQEIHGRMYQHFNNGHLVDDVYEEIERIEYIEVDCETTMNLLEIYLINKNKPKYNNRRKYNGFERIEYFEQISSGWKELEYIIHKD